MEDRRKYPRFPAADKAFMVGLNGPAHIVDISFGGLGVEYRGGETLPDEFIVDLLHATKSVVIDRVRCRKARDETRGKVTLFSYIQERRLGIEFIEPSEETFHSLQLFESARGKMEQDISV